MALALSRLKCDCRPHSRGSGWGSFSSPGVKESNQALSTKQKAHHLCQASARQVKGARVTEDVRRGDLIRTSRTEGRPGQSGGVMFRTLSVPQCAVCQMGIMSAFHVGLSWVSTRRYIKVLRTLPGSCEHHKVLIINIIIPQIQAGRVDVEELSNLACCQLIKISSSWPLGAPFWSLGNFFYGNVRSTGRSGASEEGVLGKPHVFPPGPCELGPITAKWKMQETLALVPVYLPLNDLGWGGEVNHREYLTFPLSSRLTHPPPPWHGTQKCRWGTCQSWSSQNRTPKPAAPTGFPSTIDGISIHPGVQSQNWEPSLTLSLFHSPQLICWQNPIGCAFKTYPDLSLLSSLPPPSLTIIQTTMISCRDHYKILPSVLPPSTLALQQPERSF